MKQSTGMRRLGFNERLRQEQQRATRRQRSAKALGWFRATGWKYFLAIALSAFAVWQGWYWVRRLNPGQMLTLKNIEIHGNQLMSWDEVLQVSGVEVGMPMSMIDTDSIQVRLQHEVKVMNAKVERSFPSTLVIGIEEAKALYLGQDKRGAWKVYSEKGSELPMAAIPSLDLPVGQYKTALGQKVVTSFLLEIRSQDSAMYREVSQVLPCADLRCVEVFFRNTDHKVLFAANMGRKEAFQHYRLLTQGLSAQMAGVKTVDLRFRGFAYTIPINKG